jgi:sirohydrochlorin ferrochelatase
MVGLLLVGHGSPDPRHAAALQRLTDRVRLLAPGPVELGFLEHDQPTPAEAAMRLRLAGADAVTLVPLLLSSGFHAGLDIPKAAAAAERACGLPVAIAGTLGQHRLIADACRQRVNDEIGPGQLLLAHPGDPNSASAEIAETVAQDLGVPVAHGLAALARHLEAATADTVVIRLLLADGVLADRISALCRDAGVDSVGVLADAPAMAELVLLRAAAAPVPRSSGAPPGS